jgi:hypothetical protein
MKSMAWKTAVEMEWRALQRKAAEVAPVMEEAELINWTLVMVMETEFESEIVPGGG